jgi:hypothetical protein
VRIVVERIPEAILSAGKDNKDSGYEGNDVTEYTKYLPKQEDR